VTDPRGNSGYFYFGADDKARFHVDPLGYATEYRYDAFGDVTHEIRYAVAVSGTYDETTAVDVIATRLTPGADDRQTTKAYDRLGQVSTITHHNTYTETFVYDAFGNKVQYKDKNDAVFNYEYDARGLLKRELAPETDVVTAVTPNVVTQRVRVAKTYEYDAFGNRTRMVEAAGLAGQERETRYMYDPLGRETRIEAPSFSVFDRASGTSTGRGRTNA
jgi:YD repeat-containing protein